MVLSAVGTSVPVPPKETTPRRVLPEVVVEVEHPWWYRRPRPEPLSPRPGHTRGMGVERKGRPGSCHNGWDPYSSSSFNGSSSYFSDTGSRSAGRTSSFIPEGPEPLLQTLGSRKSRCLLLLSIIITISFYTGIKTVIGCNSDSVHSESYQSLEGAVSRPGPRLPAPSHPRTSETPSVVERGTSPGDPPSTSSSVRASCTDVRRFSGSSIGCSSTTSPCSRSCSTWSSRSDSLTSL